MELILDSSKELQLRRWSKQTTNFENWKNDLGSTPDDREMAQIGASDRTLWQFREDSRKPTVKRKDSFGKMKTKLA